MTGGTGADRLIRSTADRDSLEVPLVAGGAAGGHRLDSSAAELHRAGRRDDRRGRNRIHGDGGDRRLRAGAAVSVRYFDGVVTGRGGGVGLIRRAADRGSVEVPLVSGRAAGGRRDAAAGAEGGRSAGSNRRRGRKRIDRYG